MGRYSNHWGTVLKNFTNISRSCECEEKCDKDSACQAWTHDGAKTCHLRKKEEGIMTYTSANYVYGTTSGEKVDYQLPLQGNCDKMNSFACGTWGESGSCWICDDYPTSCEPVQWCNTFRFRKALGLPKKFLDSLSCYKCS